MKLAEFFEDTDRRLSMTRLLMFLSFFPASYVVLCDQDEATLGWYLSAYAAAYGLGKFSDARGKNANVAEVSESHSYRVSGEPLDSSDAPLPTPAGKSKPVRYANHPSGQYKRPKR